LAPLPPKPRNYYFDNAHVERLLTKYVGGGCVELALRNEIMSHAMELIRQIIRTHNLHIIYPGRNQASFNDLVQVAWCQIESALYKFIPGKAKVFNLWSQIAKTVILAHIKKETRDKKNATPYSGHLNERHKDVRCLTLDRFVHEAHEIFKYNDEYLKIVAAIELLGEEDDRPHDGFIGKLAKKARVSKSKVSSFIKLIRLRGHNFTDSGINDKSRSIYVRHSKAHFDSEDDED
jgi:DNA-directed RNA polymerase specialized sigma24 family protein